ncbi:MAG: proline dehydrogenase family protein [Actinomycetota bacterium]
MSDQRRDDFDALIADAVAKTDGDAARADASPALPQPEDVEVVDEQRADEPLSVFRPADSLPAFEVDDMTFAAATNPYEPVEMPGVERASAPASGWSLSRDVADVPTVQMDAAALQAELRAASHAAPTDARDAAAREHHTVSPEVAPQEVAPQEEAPREVAPETVTTETAALPPSDRPRIGGLAAAVSARAAAAAAAQPEPEPEPQPEPEPEPEPEPQPRPEPSPQPKPEPPAAPAAAAGVRNPVSASAPPQAAPVELTDPDTDDPIALAAIERVREWVARPHGKPDKPAERLAGLLKDPAGLDFAVGFVDRVVRPEDARVSARNFEILSRDIPGFLDWYLKLGVTVGGGFGIVTPRLVIPIVKRAMRDMVSHLVIDASPNRLARPLARLREGGTRLNVRLLGEAVLGEREAQRRLEGTMALLQRDDVDHVSVTVSEIAPRPRLWAFDETVDHAVERLLPLYRLAAESSPHKRIDLEVEEYRDLDLTMAVFERLLTRPELAGLEAGIVLQAYLPEALGAYRRLAAFAKQRRADGGAGIAVRLVKGANLAMERVDAAVHGWPLAVTRSKAASDASFKRVLREALQPENAVAVRLGIGSHNLFDLAYAAELARHHGTLERVDAEMLLGMAAEHRDAVREAFSGLILLTPVVRPDRFDAAVAYLIRRLEEHASGEGFMSSMADLVDPAVLQRERDRFLRSLALLDREGAAREPRPNRTQNRLGDLSVSVTHPLAFENEPDTDPSLAPNRDWARQIVARAAESRLGERTLDMNRIDDWPTLQRRIDRAAQAGGGWAGLGARRRAEILRDAAEALGVYRGRLIEVMIAETGKTLAEADPEVSQAIDFARYYAEQAILLEQVEAAAPRPVALTVVAPAWSLPVANPCGGVTAALATGSAVIVKPAPQARRSAAVMLEALWEAGVPRDVLVLCDMDEGDLSQRLIAHPAVGRVILTGSARTAERFTTWRGDLPLLAETSGTNSIIVTPSADVDLAAADIVRSAFSQSGQRCSAASVAILVGTAGDSERLRHQLIDAATALRVGSPLDARTDVGPLIEPAQGELLRALTTLEEGEEWLLEPRQLDESGRLWSPGIRDAVLPGSAAHVAELFGPHLSLIEVDSLEEAIDVQNATEHGLTAGIHSLDPDEVAHWLDEVQAGSLFVNRGITGAIVRRQPFGGWKLSQVGPGAKAGGPNRLATLVDWEPVRTEPKKSVRLHGLHRRVASLIEAATPQLDFIEFDRVRAGANSDERWWQDEFGVSKDVSELGVERNVLRYRPAEVLIRIADDGELGDAVRMLAAAARTRAVVRISTALELPSGVLKLGRLPIPRVRIEEVVAESDAEFHERIRSGEALEPVHNEDALGLVRVSEPVRRIRLVGTDPELRAALAGSARVAVYDGPVTTEGRIELLPFLHEQSISITAHRFGYPDKQLLALRV